MGLSKDLWISLNPEIEEEDELDDFLTGLQADESYPIIGLHRHDDELIPF